MALENFDLIVERAKLSGKKNRVVIAGADAENILLGTFEAQEAGFATPVLVGEADKTRLMSWWRHSPKKMWSRKRLIWSSRARAIF